MAEIVDRNPAPPTGGTVFHWALAYDLLLRILWRGSERSYRDRVIQLAGLSAGESVLDVGCGTGTLAIAASRRVGSGGKVSGIDASIEMIARARSKAAKAAVDIDFRIAPAEALPFRNATFDAVLSTTVLHCLPSAARARCVSEMARVVKPGGRLLLIDFGGPAQGRRSLIGHLRHHREFNLLEVVPVLREAGLEDIRSAALGFSDLQYALAKAPAPSA
jgi:ubiquinone/menaquinone biosynthesis C-methylase UbiE